MKKIYVLLAVGASFTVLAYSGFLDREPLTTLNSEVSFSDANAVNDYINGLYIALPSFGTYNMGVRGEEKNSDNIVAEVYDKRLNGELRENEGGTTERQKGYQNLRNVNYFFGHYKVSEMEKMKDVFSMKGEAYFFRAYWHFYLLTRFGSIPAMDKFWDGSATVGGLQIPPHDRSAVTQLILDDLSTAKGLLHSRSQYKGLRVCKEAVTITIMRAALYEGTWEKYYKGTNFATTGDKSADLPGQVLTLGNELFGMGLALNTKATDKNTVNIEDAYAYIFDSKNLPDMTEVVFWKKYSIADGVVHNLSSNLGAGYVDNNGSAGLSQSLIDNYLNANGASINPVGGTSKDFNLTFKGRDGRLLVTVMYSDYKFRSTSPKSKSKAILIEEYPEESKQIVRPPYLIEGNPARSATGYHIRMGIDTTYVSGQGEMSLLVVRYAETLPTYMETAEELGKCTPAVLEKTLRPLRGRAGATYKGPPEIDPNLTDFGYTTSTSLQEIRRERRVEPALQDFCLNDLVHWGAHRLIQGKRGAGAYFGIGGVLRRAFDPKNAADLKAILTIGGRLNPQKELLSRGCQFDANRDYLLPIPPSEISLNHELKQNPGWQRKQGNGTRFICDDQIDKDMKNMLYKIPSVCLLTIGLTGYEGETKHRPLPEAIPLIISINKKASVMGRHLEADTKVEPDADSNEVVANENFDTYFTTKAGTEDVANVSEPFSSIVTFLKGEKQIQVDFPVRTSGLVGIITMEFVASARGYKTANSSQGIKVSDCYRISMSLENNTESMVTEGGKFVLAVKVGKSSSVPLEVTITPKEGEEDRYDNLPSTLTIPAGRTSVKNAAVTIRQDYEMTGDLQSVLNLKSNSSPNPTTAPVLIIIMTDPESVADPDLYDVTTVYKNPDIMLISYDDDWFMGKETVKMDEGTAHLNTELGSQWKFDYAIEFHKDSMSGDYQKLGNATDANRENILKIDQIKYAKATGGGELDICVGVEGTNCGAAGIHYCKSLGQIRAQDVIRIYPGMCIEMKVRLGGNRIRFVPMIEVKNPATATICKEVKQSICILRDVPGSAITQSVRGKVVSDAKNVASAIPKVENCSIYWAELVDENTIKLSINDSITLGVTRGMLGSWPFTKASTGISVGARGLYLVMRMNSFGEGSGVPSELLADWDIELKSINPANYATEGPRMIIDWTRFHMNGNYKREANELVNRDCKALIPGKFYQFY